ncbi:MAG: hypothetical protein II942_02985 [Alphaproteobacteria bacterium]|nr:hypothetical protein [Alphaproteobacteria bacterium]
MDILLFAAIVALMYSGTLFGFRWWLSRQASAKASLLSGATAFLVGAMMLGLAACVTISSTLTPRIYATLILPVFVILYICVRCPRQNWFVFWAPLICYGGTFVLKSIFPNVSITWDERIVFAVVWFSVMNLIQFFNRLPFVSVLTVSAWAIGFGLVSIVMGFVPLALAVLLGLLVAPLWAVSSVLSEHQEGRLGYASSCIVGFVMGAVVVGSLLNGIGWALMPLLSYYAFELCLLGLTFVGAHPLGMERGQMALDSVLIPENAGSILTSLFKHLLILSLLGTVLWGTQNVQWLSIITLLVLIDLYNHFHLKGKPMPGYKDMWNDVKSSVKELWTSGKKLSLSVLKKEQTKPAKTTPSKKKKAKVKRKKKK